MNGEDAFAQYEHILSDYERKEIKEINLVYYVRPVRKDESENPQIIKYNTGMDNEDGDYLFEIGDHINYRYEILKKLG